MQDTPDQPPQDAGSPRSETDSYPFTPLGERPQERVPAGDTLPGRQLRSLLAVAATLLIVGLLLPYVAERVQYGITRGRLQAEYEAALEYSDQLSLAPLSTAYKLVTSRVAPSVVHIKVMREDPSSYGLASGIIVNARGHVLTNHHVIRDGREIEVTLNDRRQLQAQLLWSDVESDLAVLAIEADDLVAAEWGDSDAVEVGELVWTIGNPLGFTHSVTAGILSGKSRGEVAELPWHRLLQTDAAISRGNSGGPLVNVQGQVIGINTAIVGKTFQGISLAIPANEAQAIYQELATHGQVSRGWLGVELDLDGSFPVEQGALVLNLVASDADAPSPAEAAGLEPGDIIVKWNNQETPSAAALMRAIGGTRAGSEVPVSLLRDNAPLTLTVTVGSRRTLFGTQPE